MVQIEDDGVSEAFVRNTMIQGLYNDKSFVNVAVRVRALH